MTYNSALRQEQPLVRNNSRNSITRVASASSRSTNGAPMIDNGSFHRGTSLAKSATPPGLKQTIGTKPTLVEKFPMRFLIMDAPTQSSLPFYIQEMKKHNVSEVVRVCEPTYMYGSEFSAAGINLHEMEYKDGTSPEKELIYSWLKLVEETFFSGRSSCPLSNNGPCIAVHCVAGLGRAPVMVAIALVEFAGMDPVEAVSFLQSKRRGAINEKQLMYLSGYKKMYKSYAAIPDSGCKCSIM